MKSKDYINSNDYEPFNFRSEKGDIIIQYKKVTK